jgi:hypothetical protein
VLVLSPLGTAEAEFTTAVGPRSLRDDRVMDGGAKLLACEVWMQAGE